MNESDSIILFFCATSASEDNSASSAFANFSNESYFLNKSAVTMFTRASVHCALRMTAISNGKNMRKKTQTSKKRMSPKKKKKLKRKKDVRKNLLQK